MKTDPYVVETLMNVKPDGQTPPEQWVHADGSPLTAAEVAVVKSASWDDWRAAAAAWRERMDRVTREHALWKEVSAIAEPHMTSGETTVAEVADKLTDAERARMNELIGELTELTEVGR